MSADGEQGGTFPQSKAFRVSLSHQQRMFDAQHQCVPCKLCGGHAVITDAGAGNGYYINCSNYSSFQTSRGCMIDQQRLGGWAYNVMEWWNRLHTAALTRRAGGDAIPAGEEWPVKWAGPLTVGNMIANLRTLPADMPIHSAYHLVREGKPARLFVKHPTVSRERVDGREIKTGDESVPYSAVIWSHGREPEIATPKPPAGGDAGVVERLDALTVERCAQVADMVPDDMIRHSEIAERIRALALPAPVVEGVNDAD